MDKLIQTLTVFNEITFCMNFKIHEVWSAKEVKILILKKFQRKILYSIFFSLAYVIFFEVAAHLRACTCTHAHARVHAHAQHTRGHTGHLHACACT